MSLKTGSFTILLTFLMTGLFAQAGGITIGNGGEGVYCPASKSVEVFDYFEARSLRGIQIDLGAASLSYLEMAKLALSRIQKLDPVYYHIFRSRLDRFAQEARFIRGSSLIPIQDSASVIVPKNCELRQIAVQKSPTFPEDPYYLIDQELWDLMDSKSKAGLILHEIIYREALQNNHANSVNTRYLNSRISSSSIESMTPENFDQLLKISNFKRYFSWLDPVTSKIWALLPFTTWIDRPQALCKKYLADSKLPSEEDLRVAFPRLQKNLDFLGLQTSPLFPRGATLIWVGSPSEIADSNPYLVSPEEFFAYDKSAFPAAATLCLFTPL